ncbi:MAG: S9 family peptidase [Ignavibacteria bacterium]|nr:S9 family peptidase [Ignavibacteria bacterium]
MKHIAGLLFFSILFISTPVISQQYSVEQYLNIRGAVSPAYCFDDSRIYFTMSVTGTTQLWYVNKPGAWPNQVTYFKERVTGYSPNPKRDLILVEKDEGGSEYDQFFLMNGNGNDLKMITDNKPKVLYGFGRWSDDGSFFTYFSNSRSPYYYDIYIYDVDKMASEMIYSSDHSNFPSAISPDGNSVVIGRSYTTYDNDLYLLNRKTGESKLLTAHDNFNDPAEFHGASFDYTGKKLYYSTNFKNDFFRICTYDLESGKTEYPELSYLNRYKDRDLSGLYFSGDRSKMLMTVNDEGYDRLYMYDLAGNREIKIPDQLNSSSITAIKFSKDNSKLIIGINSYAGPSVLYEWEIASNAVNQITYPSLGSVDPATFVEPELIKYKSFDGLEIPAFLYLPKTGNTKNLPCIISIHGGPEAQATYGFAAIFQYFLNAGYAIIEPNVRGSSGYGKKFASLDNVKARESSVKDIAKLVEYLKSRGDIDPGRIAVYGGSYGGYMVLACMTLYPELFAAGVDVVGISNFITFMQNTADYRRKNRESEYGSLETDVEFLKSISPVHKVENIRSPLMIIHGRNDPRVPVGEAEQMHKAITDRGGNSELLIYEDEGHGIAKMKNKLDMYPKMVEFLDKYVKNK